ncbi:MAG TPA: sigma-54 dependent transcriptional regulator [Acidobacteriota bacterium]|nr:sigma-54 dependent transcriptional regulator [Acidobacteriota bacterium]
MKILIVDDEETARYGMRKTLKVRGKVFEAGNLTAARRIFEEERPELVLLDLRLEGEDGFDLLDELMARSDPPMVIVITAHGNEKIAVEAMQRGAFHYVAKPFDIDELRLIVRNAAQQIELRQENVNLKAELAAASGYGDLIGSSEAMKQVYQLVEKVAETDVTILLTGESGSGKELVAREIHRRSPRSDKRLVCVNCAAIPENLIESELFGHEKGAFTGATQSRTGKFEQADGGTLFLDEVGDMPAETQAKILRVLEDGRIERLGGDRSIEVDVRLISATNRDLKQMVSEGDFREDLYYRLEVVQIEVPPLRLRRQDIPALVQYFSQIFAAKHERPQPEFSDEAMARLSAFHFPGNVRQLRNIVERLVVLGNQETIQVEDLPDEVVHYLPGSGVDTSGQQLEPFFQLDFKEAREEFEKRYLRWQLREHDHNITHTAQAIGIHRQSLQQKMKDLDLRKDD